MIDELAIEEARAHPEFGANGWLTFYFCGNPDEHARIKPALISMGAVNLEGAESGFVYAKIPVPLDVATVEKRIAKVKALAENSGPRIDIIDLDSSPDLEASKFFTVWLPHWDEDD